MLLNYFLGKITIDNTKIIMKSTIDIVFNGLLENQILLFFYGKKNHLFLMLFTLSYNVYESSKTF